MLVCSYAHGIRFVVLSLLFTEDTEGPLLHNNPLPNGRIMYKFSDCKLD